MTDTLNEIIAQKEKKLLTNRRWIIINLFLCLFAFITLHYASDKTNEILEKSLSKICDEPLGITMLAIQAKPELKENPIKLLKICNNDIKTYIEINKIKTLLSWTSQAFIILPFFLLLVIVKFIADEKSGREDLQTLIAIRDAIESNKKGNT